LQFASESSSTRDSLGFGTDESKLIFKVKAYKGNVNKTFTLEIYKVP